MNNNSFYGWDNYDDNLLGSAPLNTIAKQKNATWSKSVEGELETTQIESFVSSADNYAYPQTAPVIGCEAKVLIFGDGFVTPGDEPTPTTDYLYFEAAKANSTISLMSTLTTAPQLEYSTDGVTWQEWQHTTVDGNHAFDTIPLGAVGDKVYFRGDNPNGLADSDVHKTNIIMTGRLSSGGSLTSLIDGDGVSLTAIPSFGFFGLLGDTSLLNVPSLGNVKEIGECGCSETFRGCTSLTSAADMSKIETIGIECCFWMYKNCTSLTSAADMSNIKHMEQDAILSMYEDCNSLALVEDGQLTFEFPALPFTDEAGNTYSTPQDVADVMMGVY